MKNSFFSLATTIIIVLQAVCFAENRYHTEEPQFDLKASTTTFTSTGSQKGMRICHCPFIPPIKEEKISSPLYADFYPHLTPWVMGRYSLGVAILP